MGSRKVNRFAGAIAAAALLLSAPAAAQSTAIILFTHKEQIPLTTYAEFMRAGIVHLRTLYGAGEGEREAVSLFGSLAWSAALQTQRAVAQATAERVFAANDGPPTAGAALLSALNDPERAHESLRPIAKTLERRR